MKPTIIAFYLPQFHPFKENDEWWGKGFTEWTNVGKAKPLFKGHNQPRVPTELGYYDLRLPIVREQQAQMAREAGVTAFCYWHYWFGNGRRLIADIFNEVLATGKPDFPFCLGWANHSWYEKTWNKDGTSSNRMLLEQTYPGIEDEKMHFQFLLNAFKDDRYVKIDGKPFLYIYDALTLPDEYLENFRKWTVEAGFPGLYLVANISLKSFPYKEKIEKKYDAITYQRIGEFTGVSTDISRLNRAIRKIKRNLKSWVTGKPQFLFDYRKTYKLLINDEDKKLNVIPEILPQWDHTPRSGKNGTLYVNTTPHFFKAHVRDAMNVISQKPDPYKIILLKSWNEWGEGNYMEPDLKYGRGFIEALGEVVNEYKEK